MTILELVDKYGIETQKQGDLFVGFCPFHRDENRPNFTVYTSTDSYFCYTCNEGGNAIKFFAKMEKISYQEAERQLNSNLQDLIDKINKKSIEPLYNELTNLQISLKIRDFLIERPDLLPEIKEVMKMADEQLLQDLEHEAATKLVGKIVFLLNNLKASCISSQSNIGESK